MRGYITVGGLGLAAQVGGTTPTMGPFGPNRVGNAGGFSPVDFGGMPVFRDRMMESRGFMTIANAGAYTTLDANGWPTTDFQTYLVEVQNFSSPPAWNSGTYKCGYTSKNGGLETITGSGCTIANKSGTSTVTFDLIPTGGLINFSITGTTGGVTNVFAMLPEYNSTLSYNISGDSTKLFTTEYLNKMKNLNVQRGLDWSNSLWNTRNETSATRNTPANTRCKQDNWGSTSSGGWPLEWLISLCNQTNTGLWWCVPINADATYVSACASLISTTLASTLPVYMELANELWNGVGVGGGYYAGVVNAYNTANPGFLNYDSATDQTTLNARYLAFRLKSIYDGFNAVFGAKMGTQVFIVSAWQTGGNGLNFFDLMYKFYVHQYGSVSPFLHFNSIAPYMTRNNSAIPSDGVNHINSNDTIAQIQSQYATNGTYQPLLSFSESQYVQGRENGLLGLLTYESGREIAGESTTVANYGLAILDPGMTPVIQNNVKAMFNSGFSLILNTSFGVVNTGSVLDPQYAMAKDYATFVSNGSPIYNALTSFQSGIPTPTRNVVSGNGSAVDALNYIDNAPGLVATYPYYGQISSFSNGPKYGIGGYLGYLINCTSPGQYGLTIAHDSGSTSGTINATCNGATVATGINVPSGLSNGAVQIGNVNLVNGPNRIIVGNGTTYGPTNPIKPKQLSFGPPIVVGPSAWQQLTLPSALSSGKVNKVFAAHDGYLYAGGGTGGVYRALVSSLVANPANVGAWQNLTSTWPKSGGTPLDVTYWAEDPSGNILAAAGIDNVNTTSAVSVIAKLNSSTLNWSVSNLYGPRFEGRGIDFDSTGAIWVAGQQNGIFKSTDGGATFSVVQADPYGHFGQTTGFIYGLSVIGGRVYWGGEGALNSTTLDFASNRIETAGAGYGLNQYHVASNGTQSVAATEIYNVGRQDSNGDIAQHFSGGSWSDSVSLNTRFWQVHVVVKGAGAHEYYYSGKHGTSGGVAQTTDGINWALINNGMPASEQQNIDWLTISPITNNLFCTFETSSVNGGEIWMR